MCKQTENEKQEQVKYLSRCANVSGSCDAAGSLGLWLPVVLELVSVVIVRFEGRAIGTMPHSPSVGLVSTGSAN